MGQAKRRKAQRWLWRLWLQTSCFRCEGSGWEPGSHDTCTACNGYATPDGTPTTPDVEFPTQLRWRAGECAHELERQRGPWWLDGIPPLVSDKAIDGRLRSAPRGQQHWLDELEVKRQVRDPVRVWPRSTTAVGVLVHSDHTGNVHSRQECSRRRCGSV